MTLVQDGNKYKLSIKNIAAAQLQIAHEVEVRERATGSIVIKVSNYSALSYVESVVTKGSSSTNQKTLQLVKMMKALYLYNMAAVEYFGDQA